ncbi:MAG: hypothetical protein EBR34_00040 [Sphingomonadaceae bacterium]|nr:hypothetical protein [Sphingomonadaceae bacterium]
MWLASYPRSGNTFLRVLLNAGFGTKVGSKYDEDYSAFSEAFGTALGRASPDLFRIVKTHDIETDAQPAIYIVRDGRAAIVSYYHYCRRFEFERSLESIIDGQTPFGSWSSHFGGWNPGRRGNTLLLRFEEVVARPEEAIEQLAEFLGTTPTGGFKGDFAKLQKTSPDFFRSGSNAKNSAELTAEQLKQFDALHGDLMHELGYYC